MTYRPVFDSDSDSIAHEGSSSVYAAQLHHCTQRKPCSSSVSANHTHAPPQCDLRHFSFPRRDPMAQARPPRDVDWATARRGVRLDGIGK